jgi:hypothetical protein
VIAGNEGFTEQNAWNLSVSSPSKQDVKTEEGLIAKLA